MNKKKNVFRIAIVGSHSTGKTTLAVALSDVLQIPYAKRDLAADIAHEIAPQKNMDQLSPSEHWKIQKRILQGYQEMLVSNRGPFVSDGTVFTWRPYTEQFVGKELLSKDSSYLNCLEILSVLKKQNSHVFYLPPEIPLVPDGFRSTSNAIRIALDNAIVNELSSVKYVKLTGTLQDRLNLAQDILFQKQKE